MFSKLKCNADIHKELPAISWLLRTARIHNELPASSWLLSTARIAINQMNVAMSSLWLLR